MTQRVPPRHPIPLAFTEHQFECYFGEMSGYVRRLTVSDQARSLYIKDGFGLFNPYGQLISSSVERQDVVERARDEGFTIFSIQ